MTFLVAGGCMSGTTQSFRPDPAIACTIQEVPIAIELSPRVRSEGYEVIPPFAVITLRAIDNRGISALRAGTAGNQPRPLPPLAVESGRHLLQFAIEGFVWEPAAELSAAGSTYPARPLPIRAVFAAEVELNTGENYLVEGRMAGGWVTNGFIVTITEERSGRVIMPPRTVGLQLPLPEI